GAAGLAHEGQRLAPGHAEIDAVERAHGGPARSEEPAAIRIELVQSFHLHDRRPDRALPARHRCATPSLPPRQLGGADAERPVAGLALEGHARDRRHRAAPGPHVGAPWREGAASGRREGGRYLAGNGHERSLALVAAEGGEAVEEPARVRMARVREDLANRAVLDQLARIHDADAVAHADHRAEVVA